MDIKHRPPLLLVGQDPVERDNSSKLTMNLNRIALSINEFEYSLSLFDQSSADTANSLRELQELSKYDYSFRKSDAGRARRGELQSLAFKANAWRRIAVHDGAVKLYYFAKAMKACIKLFKLCPTLHLEVELSDLEGLWEEFEREFPDWRSCRNAVTHEGDIIGDEMSAHVTKDSYNSPSITASPGNLITEMNGTRFSTTWKHEIVGYDVSLDTVDKLKDIANRFYFLFDPSSGLDKAFTTPEHAGISRYVQQEWRRTAMKARREAAEASKNSPKG